MNIAAERKSLHQMVPVLSPYHASRALKVYDEFLAENEGKEGWSIDQWEVHLNSDFLGDDAIAPIGTPHKFGFFPVPFPYSRRELECYTQAGQACTIWFGPNVVEDEQERLGYQPTYTFSKLLCERQCREFMDSYGVTDLVEYWNEAEGRREPDYRDYRMKGSLENQEVVCLWDRSIQSPTWISGQMVDKVHTLIREREGLTDSRAELPFSSGNVTIICLDERSF
jgi:hypothetical protein